MGRFLPRTLRARLALWYLLLFGVVLIAFGGAIGWQVRQSLLDGVDASLRARASTVLGQLTLQHGAFRYSSGDAPRADAETAVYLFDRQGRDVDRIAGSATMPPLSAVLGPALRGGSSYIDRGNLRVYLQGVRDVQGQTIGAIEVLRSLASTQDTLRELLLLLVVLIPALLAAATVGGIFLAGRALAPIDHMSATARQIGAGDLHERISLAPRDDEVGRLAATFNGMLDRLERAFAHQRQFVADASHELRTPLAIARSELDILRRYPRSLAEHEVFARDLDEELTRLSRIVEDLLTLARADSGDVELEREIVSLDKLVQEVASGLRRLATAKEVHLTCHLDPDVIVVGDPTRLRQLLLNVGGNAVKYTPSGGHVRITLRGSPTTALLEVTDTGIGIAAVDVSRIFDRFFRADKARSRDEGGTGLGLSIARWCVEAHGGTIGASSQLGRGSTFTITLPRAALG